MHSLQGYRVIGANRIDLLVDGKEAYPAMLDAIGMAQSTIVLESYIFSSDQTGQRFVDALTERASQGVTVRVLVDGVGSLGTDFAVFAPLINAGGQVAIFRPPAPWQPSWGWWQRDHRKLLIIDDKVGFIGGLNIANVYAPLSWEGGGNWHDMHARIEGQAARELTKLVNRTWKRVTKEDWNARLGAPHTAGSTDVQILESQLTQRHSIRRGYIHAIRKARHSVRICNAYCIPDRGIRRALRNAAKRGVKVQLLLAGRTDVPAVRFAARALYGRLMKAGIEIYEWYEHVLHAKVAVIDGVWCSIGSYNLDWRSLMHNLEANIVCADETLGKSLDTQFETDIAKARQIDPRMWHRRTSSEKIIEQFFYQLRYLL